jgi:hypothetical protein
MAEKTVQLTAPNGAKVTVAADRVDLFTRYGFTAEAPKAPAKKSASSKSKK